jgi:glycosyl transferase family 25
MATGTEIPPIFVINLEDRHDRWTEIQNAFQSWNVKIERIDAIRRKPGWKGCSLSHKKCIQIAKDRGYPWVIVLEDDAIPTEGSLNRLRSLLPILWESRDTWDMFHGGPTYLYETVVVSTDPPLFDVKSYATHFCLIHEGVYDKILREVNEDVKIDVYYSRNLRTLCTVPHLSLQRQGYSDIEKKEIDYMPLFDGSRDILETKLVLHKWDFIPQTTGVVLFVLAAVSVGLALKRKFH